MNSKTILLGIKWAGIEFALGAFFRFFVKLALAKMLLPKDFGLVGMTSIFVSVISAASELGMGAALIQKKDQQLVAKFYNTAFWTGLVWGAVLYLIMCFVIGPFAAIFYNEPILIRLIPVLSIGIFLKPFNLIHTVILTRSMNFKKMAIVNNSAAVVAGLCGLILAYFGFGVWALAINNFLAITLSVPLLFLITNWKPKFEWIKNYFKEIFGFGMYSTGTTVFATTTYNIDNLMIGRFLGTTSLGAYTLAFSLTEVLRQTISSILNKVMYPVFGQLQNDKKKLKSYFLKIININAIIIYPLMFFFVLFAKELVIGIFGNKWIETILPLRILAIAMMIHLIINSFTSLLRGLGYPGIEFKIIFGLTLFVLIPGLYIGIVNWGLLGATVAILINKIFLVIVALMVLKKHLEIRLIEIINTIKGSVLSIIIAGLFSLALKTYFIETHWTFILCFYHLIYIGCIYSLERKTFIFLKSSIF